MIMLRCAGGGLLVVFNTHTALNIYAGKVNQVIVDLRMTKMRCVFCERYDIAQFYCVDSQFIFPCIVPNYQ